MVRIIYVAKGQETGIFGVLELVDHVTGAQDLVAGLGGYLCSATLILAK